MQFKGSNDYPYTAKRFSSKVLDICRIIRCLIDNVVVSSPGDGLKAEIHWKGGHVSSVEVKRTRSSIHRYVTDQDIVDLVG